MMSPDLLFPISLMSTRGLIVTKGRFQRKHALAHRNLHLVILLLNIQPELLELLNNLHPCMEPLHSLKRASIRIDRAVVIEDVQELEVMPLANLVVVRVVRGRDLDRTRAEFHVRERVGNDGDPSCGDEGVLHEFAVEVLLVR